MVFSFAERQQGGTTYTLDDVGSMPVGNYTPANDFTYLVISDENMSAANYRLLQGETPLSGIVSAGEMGRGGMGGGPRPDGEGRPPEGEPGQERPQPGKDGIDPPNQERPEDGTRPQRPEGFGGMPGAMQADGERVTVFTIAEGGNFITQVAPAEAEN